MLKLFRICPDLVGVVPDLVLVVPDLDGGVPDPVGVVRDLLCNGKAHAVVVHVELGVEPSAGNVQNSFSNSLSIVNCVTAVQGDKKKIQKMSKMLTYTTFT
jgi:hypothetical protein